MLRPPVCQKRSGPPDLDVYRSRFEPSSYLLDPLDRRRFVRQLQGHSRRAWGALERVAEDRQRNRGFLREKIRAVSMPPCPLQSIPFLSQTPDQAGHVSFKGGFGLYLSLIPDRGATDHLH